MTLHDLPGYIVKLAQGRAEAVARMTPEEAAQDIAARKARRARHVERKAAFRARLARVNKLASIGWKPSEIAAAEGISARYFRKIILDWGIPVTSREGHRLLSAWVRDDHAQTAGIIAASNGLELAAFLERILAAALADDGHAAKRLTGLRMKKEPAI